MSEETLKKLNDIHLLYSMPYKVENMRAEHYAINEYEKLVYSQIKEIERLKNIPNKIKEYLKQVHIETQNGILSSNNLIWENIERLCDGKDIIGSDKK